MAIRIGANPICWSNDDMPEIGGWISLDQCLSQARDYGIEGMEIGNKFPRDPKILGPLLKAKNLALVGGWYSCALLKRSGREEFKAAAQHRHLCRKLGVKAFIVAECSNTIHGNMKAPLNTRPVMSKDEWKSFTKNLSILAKLLKEEEGFNLVYHHHMGTVIQNGGEIDRLMHETTDHVGLALDTGHSTWAGDDPVRLAKTYRKRIRHLHCKDVRLDVKMQAEKNNWSFLEAVLKGIYTVPGDGTVDYPAVFKALKGYSGWVILEAEQDAKIAPPEKYVPMGVRNLKKYLGEAGWI
jgi:myo-inosose-2 dehydratase